MKIKLLSVFVAAGVLALVVKPANATFSLFLDNTTGTSFTVTDNGAGDTDNTVGVIHFTNQDVADSKVLAGYTTLDITVTSNAPGAALSFVNTNQTNILSDGALALHLISQDTTFSAPAGSPLGITNGLTAQTNVGSATITQTTLLDGSSGLPTPDTVSGTTNSSTGLALQQTRTANRVNPTFTLTTDVTMSFTSGYNGLITDRSNVQAGGQAPAPEPASLVIWGGLLTVGAVLGTARRRGKRADCN
jgi:hypothetical protein